MGDFLYGQCYYFQVRVVLLFDGGLKDRYDCPNLAK